MAQSDAVWGVHIKHLQNVGEDWPIEKGLVAIGWHELGDLSSIPATRDAFKAAYAQHIPEAKAGSIPVCAGQLFRFVHEMNVGDVVVYPSKHNRMVNIGRVSGDYMYVLDNEAQYPNRRLVKWERQINRDNFSQSALYEIGSAMTLFKISSNAEEFLAALQGDVEPQATILDEETAATIAQQFEETTEDFIIKRLKESQSSYDFEHFVAHLLQCMGYFARVTKASGDGGIDVIAHRDELGFEPPIIKVQCKQSLGSHGRPDVQKLYGAIEQGEKGLFVTLGSYSSDARTFEQGKSNLRLIDGKELVELIFAHYERFSPRYRAFLPLKQTFSPSL